MHNFTRSMLAGATVGVVFCLTFQTINLGGIMVWSLCVLLYTGFSLKERSL